MNIKGRFHSKCQACMDEITCSKFVFAIREKKPLRAKLFSQQFEGRIMNIELYSRLDFNFRTYHISFGFTPVQKMSVFNVTNTDKCVFQHCAKYEQQTHKQIPINCLHVTDTW